MEIVQPTNYIHRAQNGGKRQGAKPSHGFNDIHFQLVESHMCLCSIHERCGCRRYPFRQANADGEAGASTRQTKLINKSFDDSRLN